MYLVNSKEKYIISIAAKAGCTLVRLIHLYMINDSLPKEYEEAIHYSRETMKKCPFYNEIHEDSFWIDDIRFNIHYRKKFNNFKYVQIYRNPYERICSMFFTKFIPNKGSTFMEMLNRLDVLERVDFHFRPQTKEKEGIHLPLSRLSEFPFNTEKFNKIRKTINNSNKTKKYTNNPRLSGIDLINYDFKNDYLKLINQMGVPNYKYILKEDIKDLIKRYHKDEFYD